MVLEPFVLFLGEEGATAENEVLGLPGRGRLTASESVTLLRISAAYVDQETSRAD